MKDMCPESFRFFDQGVRKAALAEPGMPAQQIVLAKLHAHLGKLLTDGMNRELSRFGITLAHWQLLMWLSNHPGQPSNPTQMCGVVTETPAGIRRLTDELFARGWIERRPSTADRRRIELSISPAGAAVVKKVKPAVWALLERVYGAFSEAEMRALEKLLKKLLGSLEEAPPKKHEETT